MGSETPGGFLDFFFGVAVFVVDVDFGAAFFDQVFLAWESMPMTRMPMPRAAIWMAIWPSFEVSVLVT